MSAPPPPLNATSYEQARHEVHPHDHAVCAYETEEEMAAALSAFLDEGLRRRELNVFVHSFDTEEEAWGFLARARPDAPALRSDEIVVVSLYTHAFEGGKSRIDYEHVKGVVDELIRASTAAGQAGVRIFVDASRRYLSARRADEWFDFEEWLGRRLQQKVGLVCAYPRADVMRPDIFPRVLATHAYRFDTAV